MNSSWTPQYVAWCREQSGVFGMRTRDAIAFDHPLERLVMSPRAFASAFVVIALELAIVAIWWVR